ncbi:SET domain-containing protein 4 [Nymphon striatum]|nr:SET domain-containing protein 4 [Nymphon striatum]
MGRSKRRRRKSKQRKEYWIDGDSQYIKLINWMQSYTEYKHSTKLKPAICEGTGRGLKAHNAIDVGEVIVSIPIQMLITKHTIHQSTNIASIFKNYEMQSIDLIMLFLVCEKYNEESIFKCYIDTLPVDYTNVTFFSKSHVQMFPDKMKLLATLKQHKIFKQCQNLFKLFKQEQLCTRYQTISYKRRSKCEPPSYSDDILLNDLRWAHSAINTRSVYFEIDGKKCWEDNIALAPFLDLLNHSATACVKAGFNESNQCYEITTMNAYKKFEEVFIKYGNHDNFQLLIEYGFVIQDNPEEKIIFTIDELVDVINGEKDCHTQQLSIIHDNNFSSGLMCTADGLSWALWTSLGILLSSYSQLKNWIITLTDSQVVKKNHNVKCAAIQLVENKLKEYQQKEFLSAEKKDSISLYVVKAESLIPGKQYNYQYYSRVVTSVPELQQQWSGLAIKATLVLQPRPTFMVCHLEDIHVERINEQIHSFRGRTGEFRAQLDYSQNLSKPFKVVYKDGLVREVYVQRNETEWSLNVKKSILNVLNVNLQRENSLEKQISGRKYDPTSNYFRVMEESMAGECETSYQIRSIPYTSNYSKNLFKVLKATNYENCKDLVMYNHSSANGQPCHECSEGNQEAGKLNNYARTFYKIGGHRQQFLIKKAYSSSKHVYSPFTTNGQSIVAVAKYGHQARIEPTIRLLDSILKDYKNMTMEKAMNTNNTAKFVEAIRQVSTFDYNKIEELYTKFVKTDLSYQLKKPSAARELFWDLLTEVGTNPAILYGINLIRNNEHTSKAHDFVNKIARVAKEPTEILADTIYGLCSHPVSTRCIRMKRACHLATAQFIGKHCQVRATDEYQSSRRNTTASRSHCRPELKTRYFNEFSKKLNESHDVENQTLYLWSLTFLQDPRIVSLVKPIIQGSTNHSLHSRVQAIWSLYSLVSSNPEQVMEVSIPTVFNTTEDHELRIAAFTVTMAAKPPLYKLFSLVKLLETNQDENVNNYIYTTLRYLSNSTLPCHKDVSENIKLAMATLKATNFSRTINQKYSWKYLDTSVNGKYNMGEFTDVTYIASNVSSIPRAVHVKIGNYFLGETITPIEFGFRAQGLDRVVDKIFGPNGIFTTAKTSLDVLSRKTRSVNYAAKELKEIKQLTNQSVGHEYLGVGLNISSLYHGYYGDSSSYYDFILKNDWRSLKQYFMRVPTFRPFSLNVSITNSTTEPTSKLSTSFRLRNYDLSSTDNYVPHYTKEDQEFKKYASSSSGHRPQTCSVTARFEAHGQKERKLDAEFVFQRTMDGQYKRVAIGAEMTPAISNSKSQKKLCMDVKMIKPVLEVKKLQELKIDGLDLGIKFDMNLNWGENCESDKTLKISSVFSRTDEQKEFLKALPKYKDHYESLTYPYLTSFPHPADLGYNPYADQYFRCLHDKSLNHFMSGSCGWFVHTVTQLEEDGSQDKLQ